MRTPSGQPHALLIGIWLAGLMLLGVVLSELSGGWVPLPRWGIVTLILGLSTIKAVLVALYYMHLQSDRRLLVLVALAPFLLIMLVLGVVLSSRFVRL
ncbi:MAG: cytochrome C oxidase subunit IV family protein [Candidatus Omnitrophica bacterium]|nr:cytochrome C oxidase subunit IV family protein [Candidatus Omnitrophota bacterium]